MVVQRSKVVSATSYTERGRPIKTLSSCCCYYKVISVALQKMHLKLKGETECWYVPVSTDVIAVMTTDMITEGPVTWQAANPTTKNTAIDQNPAKPVLNSLVISGQVVCLTCLTTRSGSRLVSSCCCPGLRNNLVVHSNLRCCLILRMLLLPAVKAETKCDVEICEDMIARVLKSQIRNFSIQIKAHFMQILAPGHTGSTC